MLWEFKAPIKYAFGYGSGVFSQSTTKSSKQQVKPMIDMIFGVKSTQHWHSLNLRQHPDHYSFLGSLGSAFVSYTQDSLGAGVYFNPYVDINGTVGSGFHRMAALRKAADVVIVSEIRGCKHRYSLPRFDHLGHLIHGRPFAQTHQHNSQ
jgi:hypothetical protein